MSQAKQPITFWIWFFFILAQIVGLFCVLNPWTARWRAPGLAFVVIEAIVLALLFFPIFFYQLFWKKETVKQSLTQTVEVILGVLSGFVP